MNTVFKGSVIVNGRSRVSETSYKTARALAEQKHENGDVTEQGIMSSLRKMAPDYKFSTNTDPQQRLQGLRNIAIHPDMLRNAANDPEVLVELKALVLNSVRHNEEHIANFHSPTGSVLVGGGFIIGESGGNSMYLSATKGLGGSGQNRERQTAISILRKRSQEWTEILLEKLEEEKRLERSRERRLLFQEQSEQVDYLSQEDYKTALDSMANRNFSNDNEERTISRRFFKNEDGELMKEIRTNRGVRVINLNDPFPM